MFYETVFAIGARSYAFALYFLETPSQHCLWGMSYQSCLFYEHFIFLKWWLSPVDLFFTQLNRRHFSEEDSTIETKNLGYTSKGFGKTWDWFLGGCNSNVNEFHQWFAFDAKFWGERRTNYWSFAFCLSTNRMPIIEPTSLFQNNIIRGLKKAWWCSTHHYRETLLMIPQLAFHIDLDIWNREKLITFTIKQVTRFTTKSIIIYNIKRIKLPYLFCILK